MAEVKRETEPTRFTRIAVEAIEKHVEDHPEHELEQINQSIENFFNHFGTQLISGFTRTHIWVSDEETGDRILLITSKN